MKIQVRAQQLLSPDLETELWQVSNDQREVISDAAAVTIASWYQAPGGVGATFAAFVSGCEVDASDLMDAIRRTTSQSPELSHLAAWVFITVETQPANDGGEAGRQNPGTVTSSEENAK
ncbi:hypothetical protein ACXJJ3_42125 (plasmid) [Kribbella sp. WER1]